MPEAVSVDVPGVGIGVLIAAVTVGVAVCSGAYVGARSGRSLEQAAVRQRAMASHEM